MSVGEEELSLVYLDVRVDECFHASLHVSFEAWMISVERSIDTNGHILLANTVDQHGQSYQ